MCDISLLCWYRGVKVLLPVWVIWKYWNCPCKFFSLGSWLVSALSTLNGEEGYNSSTDLNLITDSSIQLQCIQARSPHHADKTTSEMLYVNLLLISLNAATYLYRNLNINIQKEWHGHQILSEMTT